METEKSTKRTQKSQEQGKPSEFGLTTASSLPGMPDFDAWTTESICLSELLRRESVMEGRRLDRAAAYEKSKETLNRWLETVKANRRAEHLSFPALSLSQPTLHKDVLDDIFEVCLRLGGFQAVSLLIQNILVESGLAEAQGKSAEEQIQSFEELQARNIPPSGESAQHRDHVAGRKGVRLCGWL
jgi:U3 small nucleolar RNA-associated protein 14